MTVEERLREASRAVKDARTGPLVDDLKLPENRMGGPMRGLLWSLLVLVLVGVPAFLLSSGPEEVAGFDPDRIPGFDRFLAETSPSQRVFFEDGVIDTAEREQAMANMVGCVRDAGYPTFTARDNPDGSFSYGAGYTHGSWERFLVPEEVTEGCMEAHFNRVDFLYGWIRINPWRGMYDDVVSQRIALCVSLQLPTSRDGYVDWEDVMMQMGDEFHTTFDACEALVIAPG